MADWITVTPSSAGGSSTASVIVAPNPGPARQGTVVVAGHIVTVSQAGAAAYAGPLISRVVTIAGAAPLLAPNTWLEIHGINFAAGQRLWQASDFLNGQMPAQLDGVSAAVNGKPAFLEYISPGQVNVLSPLDSAQGAVPVQVTSGALTSPPIYVPMQAAAPGFFLFAAGPYVAATHADGGYLGPAGLYPGATTPARPGEVVTRYAGGFGQTTPPLVNGSLVQSGALPNPPLITVGGARAAVQFAGAVSPGLYQFNIVIPDSTTDGDQPVAAAYAGFSTPAGALISVHR